MRGVMWPGLGAGALATVVVACAPPNDATPYPATEPPDGGAAPTKTTDGPPDDPTPRKALGVATYFDRTVDLDPFLAGFPYADFNHDLEHGRVFFTDKSEDYALKMFEVPPASGAGKWELATAKTVSKVDWSKRSLWGLELHAPSNTLWLLADARNDEQMNLWTLSLDSGELTQVTEHDYVYGFGFDEAAGRIAYLPRSGKKAPFRSCLHILDVQTRDDREIVCDTPALTLTWSSPQFSKDGNEVFLDAQVSGDRNRVQLVRVDLKASTPKLEVITNRSKPRNSPTILDGWLDDDTLLYLSNEDGYDNLWSYSRAHKTTKQLTRYKEDLDSAKLVGTEVVGVHGTPAGSTVVRLDARSGKELAADKLPGQVSVSDAFGDVAVLTQYSADIRYEERRVDLSKPGVASTPIVELSEALQDQIVACKATAVEIPTFDRKLHAFLLEPKEPIAKPERQLAMITAFYGGSNRYSTFDHVMCAAGLTVLSPAVRGSSGFGKAFSALNDKDLGGDEIVDLFYAARWLEKRTGLPADRIGVFGGSHGGYATMRALTYPPKTNGRNESYAFGFGMSHAGFSDIKSFYDATNIPDWVVLESGDPNVPKELVRMRDRSPMAHVDLLQAPLLLTHGSADWRVPVDESRQFAAEAKKLQRPVQYVEFEGQGHHIEGLELQAKLFQARFDFLRAVAEGVTEAERASR